MPGRTSLKEFLIGFLMIISVVAAVAFCYILVMLTIYITEISAPARPIQDVSLNGFKYVLTCRPRMEFGVDLDLYQCKDTYDNTCTRVAGGAAYNSCDGDIRLQVKGEQIEVADPGSLSMPVVFTYNPAR